MNNTKKQYEEYLNEIGNSFYNCAYLSGNRPNRIKETKIWFYLARNKYGYMLRKYDSIAFNVGYNEWKRENEYHKRK